YGTAQDALTLETPLHTQTAKDREALTLAHMQKYFSGGYTGCGGEVSNPIGTVTAADHNALCLSHIAEFKGKDKGQACDEPLRTTTAGGGQFGTVYTTVEHYSSGIDLKYWPRVRELLNKYCDYKLTANEVLLIWIAGTAYFIADIGLRMLTPKELYAATGFPNDYIIERDYLGNEYGKTKQVARCGNAVPPPFATALVRANLPEWCTKKISTMAELEREVAV
ncbi:MAG: DNA cytosine methyltransferase, partial [Clostridiales bacterium]|nr:DNA cytosine methyltransferase [Clostridiales bacterium]